MQGANGKLGIITVYQHAYFNFGCGDHVNINALVSQHGKHLLRDTGMATHADTDD